MLDRINNLLLLVFNLKYLFNLQLYVFNNLLCVIII